MASTVVLSLFGGVCLILYGMRLAGDGLQKAAGTRLRQILLSVTDNRLKAMGVGALITAILQSSSATTVMLVGFVGSGLMRFTETMGMILGADVGTTFTVQIIAFKVYNYAIFFIGIGTLMILQRRRAALRDIGQAILGFAFVFLALKILIETISPVSSNPLLKEIIMGISDDTVMMIILSALFTALLHSSAATIGLTLTMVLNGLIDVRTSIPIILGANIGTCISAITSSIGGGVDARRVALAHTLFKIIGVILFLPFITPFADLVSMTATDVGRQVANAHTLFNIFIALIFLPFIKPFSSLIEYLIPERPEEEERFSPKYLDEQVLSSPPLAMGQAVREALRMSDIVQEMLRDCIEVFRRDDTALLESIERRDDRVDLLDREIKLYLTKLSQESLTDEQAQREMEIIAFTSDLENIGDVIDKNLMELAKKKIKNNLSFSREGMEEILMFHRMIMENYELGVLVFTSGEIELAERLLAKKAEIAEKEASLRQAHINRLHLGLRESIDTSSIHLDILTNLKRINSHITNIAYPVLAKGKQKT